MKYEIKEYRKYELSKIVIFFFRKISFKKSIKKFVEVLVQVFNANDRRVGRLQAKLDSLESILTLQQELIDENENDTL